MLDRIVAAVAQHKMFTIGQRVGVAVSGGADSVFLLHALHELAPRWNLHLSVVHIEHGIRGEASKDDARFVRELAAQFGLPFQAREANVIAMDDNLEQAARRVRHDFYAELISSGAADRIATGHTRSDQAETVLYRILRGSGLAGLAGILPVTTEGLVRPLLEIDRPEIECWLRERRIAWKEDDTNRDLSYARNRLRHEILPLLRQGFNPNLDQALAQMAVLARDEERYWAEIVDRKPGLAAAHGPLHILPTSVLRESPALGRRTVRVVIEHIRGDLRQIEFGHIERILQMATGSEGHDRVQIPGVDVIRSFDWIRFAPLGFDSDRGRDYNIPLEVPGSGEPPDRSGRITLQLQEMAGRDGAYVTVGDELDWARLNSLPAPDGMRSGLELRNWRPGDQYRRVGQSHEEKIKQLFQEFRVPLWERRFWPIITYHGKIVWTRRFGVAQEYAPGPGTRLVLRVGEASPPEKGSRDGVL